MMFLFKKKCLSFFIIFIFVSFLIFTSTVFVKKTFAYPLDGGYEDCTGATGWCSTPAPADCNNGPSNTDGGGCGTACGVGNAWSKYTAVCKQINETDPCSYAWVYSDKVCSTGDKCLGETGLRSGSCDCSYSTSLYKWCCDAGGSPQQCIGGFPDDGTYPPEGACPGGTYSSACVPSQPTNTPIPPQPGGSCDSTCGQGVCGYYRNSDGACITDNGCCHRICSGSSCTTVSGTGSSACDTDLQCTGSPTSTPASGCSGVEYFINPPATNGVSSQVPLQPNTSTLVNISRTNASSGLGWGNVGLNLDGVSQGILLCYGDGVTNCDQGYHLTINSGNPPSHTLQFTINNGANLCNSQDFAIVSPTSTPTPTPLLCSSNFNVSCAGSGAQATISWNALIGAVRYILRLNHEPYDSPANWYNEAQGDQWQELTSSSIDLNITPGANYQYDVQGIKPGESYPYSGARCPFNIFSCLLLTPTPTSAPTPTSIPTATPTVTPILSPTPTTAPGPWIKLKNSSFSSPASLTNVIPPNIAAYDADDDVSQRYFIMNSTGNDPGLVTASSINIGTANVSSKNWKADYIQAPTLTPSVFLSYVKSRKKYQTISNLSSIDKDGIYVWDDSVNFPDITDTTTIPSFNFVLISTVKPITIQRTNFDPAKSIAIIANSIIFSHSVEEATGIFIANNINTGTTVNQGLKIIGNLIAQTSLINGREWTDANRPSLFIVFDPEQYINLLPYLSTASYDWRQVQ